MTLLFLAIAYIVGVAAGSGLIWAAWLGCDVPVWGWLLPLAALPLTALIQGRWFAGATDDEFLPLQWPESAGFVRPQRGLGRGVVVAILLCVLMGALRMASVPRDGCWGMEDLAWWNLPSHDAFIKDAPQVSVTGYISNFPTVDASRDVARQEVVVTVSRVRDLGEPNAPWFAVDGRVRLVTAARPRYQYGQPVEVTGRLATPPDFEDFSYREFLARQGIHSHFYDAYVVVRDGPTQGDAWRRWLYVLRARAMGIIAQGLPEPHASLAQGILLGVDAGIPDALYDRFNATGTSHVLVISGSNVALIAALILGLSRRTVGRWATLVALLGIGAYAIFVGAEAAVLRAALMGGLLVVAAAVGRRSTALISLAVACWLMLLVNPLTLYDVGFQLSAMATLGLILLAGRMNAWLAEQWPTLQGGMLTGDGQADGSGLGHLLRGMLVDAGVMTLAASVLTLPLVAFHFQRVSLLGIFANLLIVPVQPLILVAGTLGVLGGLIGPMWIAQGFLWVAWLGLSWTVEWVDVLARLPGASLEVAGYGFVALLATYALIAGAMLVPMPFASIISSVISSTLTVGKNKEKIDLATLHPKRLTSAAGLGTLVVIASLVWAAVFSLPDGRLHVYFLDIGQGDGILIQTPSGRRILIDGGPNREQLLTQLGDVMPWWERKIDMLVVTHPDHDHIGAQEIVPERYRIEYALDTPAMQIDPDAQEWRDAVETSRADIFVQHVGGWVDLGDGVALWVFWPPEEPMIGTNASNENSLVAKLVYGDFSVLLTGDAGIPSESTWLAENLPLEARVLKVGHHGSAHSTSTGLVEAVDPEWAVIQVGAGNRYGHPTDVVLNTLAGRTILRNDEDGRIHFSTDGSEIWVETER